MFDSDQFGNENHDHIVFYQEKRHGNHKELNFDIEKYFHDIKHVRKVPLQDIIKKIPDGHNIQTKVRDSVLIEFKKYQLDGFGSYEENDCKPLLGDHLLSRAVNDANQYLRKVVKFHWLIHDLQENELNDPPLALITQGPRSSVCFHPGGCRSSASFMLGQNPDCIVYDFYYEFANYPKLEWNDVCEMYKGVRNLSVNYHKRLPYGIPDIANNHEDGILHNCDDIWVEWSKKCISMWDKPLKIFIGYDSTHGDMSEVCAASILQQFDLDRYPEIVDMFEIYRIDVSQIPEYTREYKDQSTEFSYSRFLVPYLSNYEGISIFVDNDFIFKDSILDLFYFVHPDSPVACVKHEFHESRSEKMNGVKNISYPKKLWSSLMVFNNAHPDCKKLTPDVINTSSGMYLHQFEWASSVSAIPNHYVWTEGYDDPSLIYERKALHFTHGGPWIDEMDYSNIDGLCYYETVLFGGMRNITFNDIDMLDYREYCNPDLEEKVDAMEQ